MAESIKILSSNIRCTVAADGADSWPHRKDLCMQVIQAQHADVICFQELTEGQEHDVAEQLPEFRRYGMPDDALRREKLNSIFYHEDRFEQIAAGGYWLSEPPHVAGSRSWESAYVRFANWVRLKDLKTGIEFRVLNTHLDCDSQPAREGQARCLVDDAAAYGAAYPQILTGDMNCDGTNAAIETFSAGAWRDSYAAVHGPADPGHSYHAFVGPAYEGEIGKMDWIFMRGAVHCLSADVIRDAVDGRFPSDHYFVSAVIELGVPAA